MITGKVEFTKEKETMLISLYSRALHSRSENPVLRDQWAEEAVDHINYDFTSIKLNKLHPLTIAIRAKQFDIFANKWISENPESIVLHLGCGLDSRIYRVNPPSKIRWFDIDYPEIIELRKQLFPERAGYIMIASSLLEYKWLNEIPHNIPTLIIAEGVMMYLPSEECGPFIKRLIGHLKSGQMAFDAMSIAGVKMGGANKAVKDTGARFGWGIDDPDDIKQYAPKMELISELSTPNLPDWKRLPLIMRILVAAMEPFPKLRRLNRILFYRF